MNSYRPPPRQPPIPERHYGRDYRDEDRPRSYRNNELEDHYRRSSDPYDEGPRYRPGSRSPRRNIEYDDREGFAIKGRQGQYVEWERERGYRDYRQKTPELPYYGEDDVAVNDDTPMRLLLVCNLKQSVTLGVFANGLMKLYRTADNDQGAVQGSLRRVFIIRHRETDEQMAFGFAEYHATDDAIAALAKARQLRNECTISSQKIEVSFPHTGVFPPAYFGTRETSNRFTIELPWTNNQRHKYYKEQYYPSVLMVNEQSPHSSSSAEKQDSNEKEKRGKKRKVPASSSSAAPSRLQYWQNKKNELRLESSSNTQLIESDQQSFSIDTPDNGKPEQKGCFLCGTFLKDAELLQQHLKEAPLHQKLLKSEEARKKGYQRLKARNVSLNATIKMLVPKPTQDAADSDSRESKAYRDRAAERRNEEAYVGGEKIGFSIKGTAKSTNSRPSPKPSDNEANKPSYGKGLGMLQMHGYQAGQGLGESSGGISTLPDQALYASGVGLGHESSKKGDAIQEAERMTKGGGFVEKTKEMARQRFEKLQ